MGEQEKIFSYEIEEYTITISAEEYIKGYNNSSCFIEFCKQCKNFGKIWACPPFSHDILDELRAYSNLILFAVKIIPHDNKIPISLIDKFIRPERVRIERKLLEMENLYKGKAFAYAGNCLYCPEGTCTRINNKPCRHPELVRPSLESYGFDLGKTAIELFGFPLLWSDNGYIPEYVTLICGLFHN